MTPSQAAEAALKADRAHDDTAIWIARVADAAIVERARLLEREGKRDRPLWGVPFAVKDNIDVAGLPTTAGCPGYAYQPDRSAPAVDRLLEAGAILIGKTNLDQFATGLVGTRSPYGVPRNVFDAARVPGGSSSGSGAAVAAGIVPFALGTDTAGSGRVPAAFGNIVGLKPTPGSISARGMVPACRSLDTISVFAETVDVALDVYRVIAGFDPTDPYARRAPVADAGRAASGAVRIATADVADLCAPATGAALARAAALLKAEIVGIAPLLDLARLLYAGPWVAERTAALQHAIAHRPDILHPVTRHILESGFDRRTVDAFLAFDRLAEARRAAELLFAEYDALLLPTAPFCPTLAEDAADPFGPNTRLGAFTNFGNLCGLSAFAVPGGIGPDGVPVGMMLLGPGFAEARLAPIADALHRANAGSVGATSRPLPKPAPRGAVRGESAPGEIVPGEISLFCIGAHMSGLALNPQLTALGGRLLREATTVPTYRLFALGTRPGMVRVPTGAAILGEIWALPTAAIGALLERVPSPLGFGTVALTDGPCLGFLAEADGVAGAPDITRFGGWRAWLAAQGGPA